MLKSAAFHCCFFALSKSTKTYIPLYGMYFRWSRLKKCICFVGLGKLLIYRWLFSLKIYKRLYNAILQTPDCLQRPDWWKEFLDKPVIGSLPPAKLWNWIDFYLATEKVLAETKTNWISSKQWFSRMTFLRFYPKCQNRFLFQLNNVPASFVLQMESHAWR